MKILLKFAFGFVLLAFLLYFVDWRQSVVLLLQLAPTPALLALLILPSCIFLSSLKWNILLRAQSLFLSLITLIRCYWIGTFFNNYFPSTVGGDIIRLTIMRNIGRLSEVSASIVLERLTGLFVLLCLSALGLLMRPQYLESVKLLSILWFIIVGISTGLTLVVIFRQYIIGRLNRISSFENDFIGGIFAKFKKFIVSIAHYENKINSLILALIISLPFYGLTIIFQFLLFVSLGLHISFWEVFFIAPLILLVSIVPISINALGLSEGAFVVFYTQVGLSPEEALAAALLRRFFHLLISLVGGIFWLSSKANLSHEGIKSSLK